MDKLELYNRYYDKANYYTIFTQLMGMFEYNGEAFNDVPIDKIETPLLRWGYVGAAKDKDDKVYYGTLTWDQIDAYNRPKEGSRGSLITISGHEVKGVYGENIVIGYNNRARLPELMLDLYADMFHQTDISLKSAVIKSRPLPIPLASDSKIANQINDLLDQIESGDTKAIAYEGALDDIIEGKPPVTMLELTDPKHIERLQYLSKFYDDMLRRLWTMYGHSLSSGSKLAQVNTKELEGYESYSRILPTQMLEARTKFCEDISNILGVSASVEYSEAWQHLNRPIEEVMDNDNSGTVNENTNNDTESEPDSE